MRVTKTEAARLAGVSRATLYAHIKAGKISLTDGKIDTSELLRVYGQLQPEKAASSDVQPDRLLDVLRGQIEFLQRQLEAAQEREKAEREEKHRLLDIVEQQSRLLAHQSGKSPGGEAASGWFDSILGRRR